MLLAHFPSKHKSYGIPRQLKQTPEQRRSNWLSISGVPCDDSVPAGYQRVLDAIVVNHTFQTQLENQTTQYHRARLLAAAAHGGDWLHAVPISACGPRLNNEAVRVAVGLRLGSELCQPYKCICGASVNTRGSHADETRVDHSAITL